MNTQDFNKAINEQITICQDLLGIKAKEYSTVDDRLKAFKTASALLDCTPEQALLGYLTKHVVSIYEMVQSGKEYSMDKWTEKISDFINYGLLLKALLVEEAENKE